MLSYGEKSWGAVVRWVVQLFFESFLGAVCEIS